MPQLQSEQAILTELVRSADPIGMVKTLQVLVNNPNAGSALRDHPARLHLLEAQEDRPGAVYRTDASGLVIVAIGGDDDSNLELADERVDANADLTVAVHTVAVAAELWTDSEGDPRLDQAVRAGLEAFRSDPPDGGGLFRKQATPDAPLVFALHNEAKALTMLLAAGSNDHEDELEREVSLRSQRILQGFAFLEFLMSSSD